MSAQLKPANGESRNLKLRFINAIKQGKIGSLEERGIIVTAKEFKLHFSDIKTQYIGSFLPTATIDPGRTYMTNTRFVFRLRKGVYLLHPDALEYEWHS